MRQPSPLAAVVVAAFLAWSCDSADPVAPPGTLLTISASPARITSDGVSEIRITARRPNGTPVNEGTILILSTTVGAIPSSVPTDARGDASALLRGDGQFGTATVSVSTGSGEAVTVDVQVGFPAASISLQSTPSSVPETGGELGLLAIVRDDQGRGLAKALVNFLTDTGTLASGGELIESDESGSARDSLAVLAADIDPVQGTTFQVRVEVGSGTGTVISSTATITIQRLPKADFTFGTNKLTVAFTDTSAGRPTQWLWNFGDGNTSTLQNPTHTYAAAATYVVTFRATNSQGSDTISKFVSVTGQ